MSEATSLALPRASSASLALLIGLAGCNPAEPMDSALARVVVSADAIRVVGTSDAIAHIEDIMPAADGAAWVLNSTDPFLVLLSQEGEELRVTGARGGGPGELSWPTTLARDPTTGTVVVYDPALGRLLPVEQGEEGASSSLVAAGARPIRLNSYEYLWTNNGGRAWIEGTESGFVFAEPIPGMPWISSLWSTEVARLMPDGEIERVVSTADVVGDPSTRFPGARRFLPYPIWTACPDGSLAVYDPNQNLLRRLSADGEALTSHELLRSGGGR